MHLEGDSTRFNQAFAFQPQINIVEGLRKLVEEILTTRASACV
jgi:nucleoside-diphosphate-sugar epimerase